MKTREAKVGKAVIRLRLTKSGYAGIVLLGDQIRVRLTDQSEERLWEALHNEAQKHNPNYVGFDGARSRFLRIFKNGFSSPIYLQKEREYKLSAKAKLDSLVSVERALTGTGFGEAILSIFQATNLMNARFEKPRIREALLGPHADLFIRGAAEFASGNLDRGIAQMEKALKPYDVAKWTAITYLPFLWMPETHMYLKPRVTQRFAERVGHSFSDEYSPKLNAAVYRSLLDLVSTIERAIADFEPADHIDVQSFIWVVGEYTAEDEAGLE